MGNALHWLHRRMDLRVCVAGVVMLAAATSLPQVSAQIMDQHHTLREVSGVVTDGHEPIRGAIVELEAEGSHDIVTYVTEADGRYHFKRLNGEEDYRVWVVFRKQHSKAHEISKFDDHMDKVINFTIEPF